MFSTRRPVLSLDSSDDEMSNEKRPLLSDGELGVHKKRFGALNNADGGSTVSRRSEPTVGYKSDNNGFDAVSIDDPLRGKASSSTRRVCTRAHLTPDSVVNKGEQLTLTWHNINVFAMKKSKRAGADSAIESASLVDGKKQILCDGRCRARAHTHACRTQCLEWRRPVNW